MSRSLVVPLLFLLALGCTKDEPIETDAGRRLMQRDAETGVLHDNDTALESVRLQVALVVGQRMFRPAMAVGGVDAVDGEAIVQDRPSPLRRRG